MENSPTMELIPTPLSMITAQTLGGNPTITEIVAPVAAHKLDQEEFRTALKTKLGTATSQAFQTRGHSLLRNLETINSGFSVLACESIENKIKCSKFMPRDGQDAKFGVRYKPGHQLTAYTRDQKVWTKGPTISLKEANLNVQVSGFLLFSVMISLY